MHKVWKHGCDLPRRASPAVLSAVGFAICLAGGLDAGPALADPPPWVQTSRMPQEKRTAYHFPAGLTDGRCRPEMFDPSKSPGLVGAASGSRGILRPDPKGHDGKLGATAIGMLMAVVRGAQKSHGISWAEETCFAQSFEHAPDRQTVAWSDTRRSIQYSVIMVRTVRTSDGNYCREYAAKATLNGHAADVYGTACRGPDGQWRLID